MTIVEGYGGMKQGGRFKGGAPDDPASPFDSRSGVTCSQEKTDGHIPGQQLSADKADAAVAEVDGPCIVLLYSGELIMAAYFGKAESVTAGNADGAATVDRIVLLLTGFSSGAGQLLVVATGRVIIGKAIVRNLLIHRQIQAILDQ